MVIGRGPLDDNRVRHPRQQSFMAQNTHSCGYMVNFSWHGWLKHQLCMACRKPVFTQYKWHGISRAAASTNPVISPAEIKHMPPAGATVAPPTTTRGGLVQGRRGKELTR